MYTTASLLIFLVHYKYLMLTKWFRIAILLLILGIAGRAGWWCYQSLVSLLSFQIHLYERLLQTQQTLAESKHELQGIRESALSLFWNEQHATTLPPADTFAEHIQLRTTKIHTIAFSLSSLMSILIFKVLFDIVFSMKKIIRDINDFVVT